VPSVANEIRARSPCRNSGNNFLEKFGRNPGASGCIPRNLEASGGNPFPFIPQHRKTGFKMFAMNKIGNRQLEIANGHSDVVLQPSRLLRSFVTLRGAQCFPCPPCLISSVKVNIGKSSLIKVNKGSRNFLRDLRVSVVKFHNLTLHNPPTTKVANCRRSKIRSKTYTLNLNTVFPVPRSAFRSPRSAAPC
jgi:hypothetical protein